MSVQGLITVIVLAGAVLFGLYNQPLLVESRTIEVPGGIYTLPLVVLVAVAAVAVVLMLLASAGAEAMWHSRYTRMAERLTARERELAEVKGHRYDELARRIDAVEEKLGGPAREHVPSRSG